MMLFSIDKSGKFLLFPEVTKLCPELQYLTEQEMICIILAYDYRSPYNQLPEEDRIRRAKAQVYKGTDTDPFKTARMQKAIELYRSLQYDRRREQLKVYNQKIDYLNNRLADRKIDESEIKEILNSCKLIRTHIKDIEQDLATEEQVNRIEGGQTLSLLEQMQTNRNEYLELIAKKQKVIPKTQT